MIRNTFKWIESTLIFFQAVRQNEVVGKDANSEQNWTSRCTSEVAQQQYDAQLDLAAGETIKMKLTLKRKQKEK